VQEQSSKQAALRRSQQRIKDEDKVLSVLRKYEAWNVIDNATQDKILRELGRLLAAERQTR